MSEEPAVGAGAVTEQGGADAADVRQPASAPVRSPPAAGERPTGPGIWKRERRRRLEDRLYQLVDYVFSLLYAALGLRLVLGLLAANQEAGFVRLIAAITQPFYRPFVGILANPALERGVFDVPLVFAIWVYVLLHLALRRLLHLLLGTRRAT